MYIYLVDVKTMRKIFSNFVSFSESPNFDKANMKLFLETGFEFGYAGTALNFINQVS